MTAAAKTSRPETVKLGRRGELVIPSALRRRLRLEEGDILVVEERPEGLLLHPAAVVPVEIYGPERKAALLLGNAVDEQDYAAARAEVTAMGLDPDAIDHDRP